MINTFELLLNVSNVSDDVKRTNAEATNELKARELVVRDYMNMYNLPETISKAQVGEIVQRFIYYYM